MERALLQGEREAERALLQKEQKAVDQLQEKLVTLETGLQKERDKVTHSRPGPVLATGGPGEGETSSLGPLLLISPTFLRTWWSLWPSGAGGRVLCGRCQLEGHGQGRGWALGSPLSGSLCCLWVPAIPGPSWPF